VTRAREPIAFVGRAMGSPLRLTTVGLRPPRARRAWQLVTADIELTESSLSRWRAESALSRLNAAAGSGEWVTVDRRLVAMLVASSRAQRISAGRFDPRVITRLEALGERAGVPLPLNSTDLGTDRPWLWCDPRSGLARVAAPIDSGGIGKGLGLRWAAAAARRAKLLGSGFLLEAGGDLIAYGAPGDAGPWQIGIEDPVGGDGPLAVVTIADGAIVTSSTAIRSWALEDGGRAHHLIDPATGEPGGDGLQAVTVAASDPAWAEVWSKTLFLEGSRGIGDAARRRGLSAWWVEADGSLHMTPAARQQTAWTVDRAA
jgi:FAD:protein FMN transferase